MSNLHPTVERVTARVIEKSRAGRARYLDLIGNRVSGEMTAAVRNGSKTPQQADQVLAAWQDAVARVRGTGSAPAALPDGLGAILNPGNVKAVAEADAIDPLELAERIPSGTPVLLTCSDADGQAPCTGMEALTRALEHTALDIVELTGVNHVLRDDPTVWLGGSDGTVTRYDVQTGEALEVPGGNAMKISAGSKLKAAAKASS